MTNNIKCVCALFSIKNRIISEHVGSTIFSSEWDEKITNLNESISSWRLSILPSASGFSRSIHELKAAQFWHSSFLLNNSQMCEQHFRFLHIKKRNLLFSPPSLSVCLHFHPAQPNLDVRVEMECLCLCACVRVRVCVRACACVDACVRVTYCDKLGWQAVLLCGQVVDGSPPTHDEVNLLGDISSHLLLDVWPVNTRTNRVSRLKHAHTHTHKPADPPLHPCVFFFACLPSEKHG